MLRATLPSLVMAAAISGPAFAGANDVRIEASVSSNAPVEQRTTSKTYEVTARGDRSESRSEVYDEALYKAAKKTRKKDYDWFRVIDSDVERETRIRDNESGFEAGYERVPYRSCGLLTCRTEYRTESRTQATLDFGSREETRYEVELEFEMGWGSMPLEGEVYDARLVRNQYR